MPAGPEKFGPRSRRAGLVSMTRTEVDSAADRQALKKEIVGEIKRDARQRKLFGCGGCLILALVVIAVPLIWVASIAARSGFVRVPLLSGWLYHPSQPARQVTPLVGSDSNAILKAVISANKYEPQTGIMTVRFTEAQLTTFVSQAVAARPDLLPFPVSSAQIAVDTTGVELFVISPQGSGSTTIKISVTPRVEKEKLELTVNEIVFGSLVVPDSIGNALVAAIDQKLNDALSASMADIGTLEGVKLEKGSLTVSFVPKITSH